jgi:hypothetical protein
VYGYYLKNLLEAERRHFFQHGLRRGTYFVITSFHTSRLAFSNFLDPFPFAFFIHCHKIGNAVSIMDKCFRATRPFLFLNRFLCFASVQNRETYPPARGKNKQALKNKVVFASCMDVKQQKFDVTLLHLSTKEILNKECEYKIITRIIESITRSLYLHNS